MLSIFLSTSSKKRIVSKHFSYLIDQGYRLSYELILNVIDQFRFSHVNGNYVNVEYDFRENYVNIEVVKDEKKLLHLDYENIHYSMDLHNVQDMLAAVEKVYTHYKSLRRYRVYRFFEEVIIIYATYLKSYF